MPDRPALMHQSGRKEDISYDRSLPDRRRHGALGRPRHRKEVRLVGRALGLITLCKERLRERAEALAALGCDVAYRAADTADQGRLKAAVRDLQARLRPVGVPVVNAHAASADPRPLTPSSVYL